MASSQLAIRDDSWIGSIESPAEHIFPRVRIAIIVVAVVLLVLAFAVGIICNPAFWKERQVEMETEIEEEDEERKFSHFESRMPRESRRRLERQRRMERISRHRVFATREDGARGTVILRKWIWSKM